jgi:2-isopropylmalate synthase
VDAVRHARSYTDNVEFSAEDGSRSDRDFLCRVFEAAIDRRRHHHQSARYRGICRPRTSSPTWCATFGPTRPISKAVFSVHCHNDLGLATANTLAAIQAGARQVEVTINGIGERAGNTSLEEIVMALHTRHNHLHLTAGSRPSTSHASSRWSA